MVIHPFTRKLSTGLLALLLSVCATLVACETAPPVQEMSDARQAIAVAKRAGAEEHAAVHLKAAEEYLAVAEKSLNEKAYHQARRNAYQAKMKAIDALKASGVSDKPDSD